MESSQCLQIGKPVQGVQLARNGSRQLSFTQFPAQEEIKHWRVYQYGAHAFQHVNEQISYRIASALSSPRMVGIDPLRGIPERMLREINENMHPRTPFGP